MYVVRPRHIRLIAYTCISRNQRHAKDYYHTKNKL